MKTNFLQRHVMCSLKSTKVETQIRYREKTLISIVVSSSITFTMDAYGNNKSCIFLIG